MLICHLVTCVVRTVIVEKDEMHFEISNFPFNWKYLLQTFFNESK